MSTQPAPTPEERAKWLHEREAPKGWLIITEDEINALSEANSIKDAQILALREALGHISYIVDKKDDAGEDLGIGTTSFKSVKRWAKEALSTPAPAVVPRSELDKAIQQMSHMAEELKLVRGFVSGPHKCLGERNLTLEQVLACITHALKSAPAVVPLAKLQDAEAGSINLAAELKRLCKEVSAYIENKGPHPIFESYLKWSEEALAAHEARKQAKV